MLQKFNATRLFYLSDFMICYFMIYYIN